MGLYLYIPPVNYQISIFNAENLRTDSKIVMISVFLPKQNSALGLSLVASLT